jgi:hypothetical protein
MPEDALTLREPVNCWSPPSVGPPAERPDPMDASTKQGTDHAGPRGTRIAAKPPFRKVGSPSAG